MHSDTVQNRLALTIFYDQKDSKVEIMCSSCLRGDIDAATFCHRVVQINDRHRNYKFNVKNNINMNH